ncbi:DUF5719 family protein [Demequina flava]|uniref:DUF5719 family protein n=1 Tax=Demequina flava TaxID=1095025 RepID=UPI000785D073|nr:DUF5719 family protein [Demequina flava]
MKWTAAIPVALAAVAVVGVSVIDLPSTESGPDPVATTLAVSPSDQPAVCPGPLEIPVGEVASGDSDLDSGSEDRALSVSPEPSEDIGEGSAVDATVATSLERVGTGDIASLAGLTCAPPRQDQWIVAGSTALGSSARAVLANPSAATVRVSITLYGPVSLDGQESFTTVVGPHSQVSVLVESIEPEMPTLAMRIQAGGVGITAALQDSRLDGFTAAGSDWATASAFGTELAVPVAGPSDADAPAALRLVAPEDASVSLAMVDEDGRREWLDGETLNLEAGLVTDVTIPAGDAGAVFVSSDVPVAAATIARTVYDIEDSDLSAGDLAWVPAQSVGDATERAVVAPDGDLTVVAASATSDRLVLTDQSGATVLDERVFADSAAVFPLDVPAGTQVTSASAVTWAVSVRDGGFMTALTPRALERLPQEVTLEAGPYAGTP